jgi:hypothetical protein
MIRFMDAALLASTKLRTRKVRTVVTATLASLLFAGLVAAFTIVDGVIGSYVAYSNNSLADRYITQVTWFDNFVQTDYESAELIAKANARNAQIIAEKKADAKRLGIVYDPNSEQPVVTQPGQGMPDMLNTQNLAAQQILAEEAAKRPTSLDKIQKLTANHTPKAIHVGSSLGDTTNLKIMNDGKELFTEEKDRQSQFGMTQPDLLSELLFMPQTIVDPFMLSGADRTPLKTADGAVPVIVPYSQAEKSLGLAPLPKSASAKARLARLTDVKQRAANVTLSVCYRNSASQQTIEETKLQIAEMEKYKNDKNYQKPVRQFALPDQALCGPVVVTKDTRTLEEKRLADKQREFDLKYKVTTEPIQKKLTLRIVGLSPDMPDYSNIDTATGLMSMIGSSSLMGRWVVPDALVDESVRSSIIPAAASDAAVSMYGMPMGDFVEFATADEAKRFVKEQSCSDRDCSSKPTVSYFGSNSVLIAEITNNASRVLRVAGMVTAAIGALLMLGMVGRVITDSRRETAVFRAIGAKRNDIRLIYTLYVIALSLLIAGLALVIGFTIAAVASNYWQDALTVQARLMFIESNEAGNFTLLGLWPEAIGLTVLTVVGVGLFAMLLPLSRNLTRSPLKDMRDE